MGRVPIENFGLSKIFLSKFCEKHFRGREPQKSTILGLFSKSILEISAKFFLKNRGNGGLFLWVRPNNYFGYFWWPVSSLKMKGFSGKFAAL